MTVLTLNDVACCYVYSLSLTDFLIPAIATTQVHPPTWAFPFSVPASPTATRDHLPTTFSIDGIMCFIFCHVATHKKSVHVMTCAAYDASRTNKSNLETANICSQGYSSV